MKDIFIDDVEITDRKIKFLSNLQTPIENSNNEQRINYYINSLSKTQDLILRNLSKFNENESLEALLLVNALVCINDDLKSIVVK